MGVYNGERFIAEQIASILPQLDKDDELVISDNLSTDKTREIVNNFGNSKIKLVTNPTFTDLIFNFENALKHALGDVILLADCDDVWLPKKVETMKSLLETYDLVVSDCVIVDAEQNILHESFFKSANVRKGVVRNIIRNSYVGCCMAFRRELLDVALPFPKNIPMHDIWLASLAELFGQTYFCDKRLMNYRRHGNNLSSTAGTSRYPLAKKIRFRIDLSLSLIRRYLEYRFSRGRRRV
jgi:glycosyltransferase involved in cell wall biosynthesis